MRLSTWEGERMGQKYIEILEQRLVSDSGSAESTWKLFENHFALQQFGQLGSLRLHFLYRGCTSLVSMSVQ